MRNERVIKPSAPLFGGQSRPTGPSKPPAESIPSAREKAPGGPPRKPSKPRMAEVTVKLPDALIEKLDRLRDKHSTGLTKPGRSTLMRWLLEREPE